MSNTEQVNVIAHVGMHKTGITWFRRAYYPFVRNATLLDRQVVQNAFLDDSAQAWTPARALSALGETRADRIILCEEQFTGHIHSGGHHGAFTVMAGDRLKSVFPRAQIVLLIRNQVDFVESAYREYVKAGGTYPMRRYLHHPCFPAQRKHPLFNFDYLDYRWLVDHYVENFSKERVKVFLYEQFQRDPLDFLGKFGGDLGLNIDLDCLSMAKANVGYGSFVLAFARFLNAFTRKDTLHKHYLVHIPRFYEKSRKVLNAMATWESRARRDARKPLLSPGERARIEDRFRDSNRRLAADSDLPLSEYGYPV